MFLLYFMHDMRRIRKKTAKGLRQSLCTPSAKYLAQFSSHVIPLEKFDRFIMSEEIRINVFQLALLLPESM